jgi:hypothetical protein
MLQNILFTGISPYRILIDTAGYALCSRERRKIRKREWINQGEKIPSGAKAPLIQRPCGTAEAVPFP